MNELDASACPGLYTRLFEQSAVGEEWVYLVYYRHTADPKGFAVEEHVVTNEVYVPLPSPIIPAVPGSVMSKLLDMENPTKPVALANADAVWDETLAQHLTPGSTGEALSKISSGSSGSKQITVRILDTLSAPLQGVQVDLYDSTNVNFLSRVWTGISGLVNLGLDPGTYALRFFKTGYGFTIPAMIVVTVDATVTFVGTGLIIVVPPSAPNLCVVYGTVRDAGGQPISNAKVQAYAVTPQTINDTQESQAIVCTVTDANGFFQLELERLAQVGFTIEDTGLDVVRTVPNLPSQDLVTWV